MTITSVSRRQFSHDNAIRDFLSGLSDPSSLPAPQWGPIGQEVYERTYSRELKTETGTRKETWAETVRRVVNGNLSYVTPDHWLEDEAVDLFDTIYNFRAIPAGRHLWVTGTESGHMSKNCFISGFSPRTSDHFRFLAARLFEGGGVGANYSFDLVGITQPILGALTIQFMCDSSHRDIEQVQRAAGSRFIAGAVVDGDTTVEHIRVEDTREGWVDTWVYLIDLATTEGQHRVVLDVSDIRPHGAPLKTFGGTASGPEPLVASIAGIATVLNHAAQGGRRLTGLEAMQMDHEIAASVVAGGARRSARMSIMSWKDPEVFDFISCKSNDQLHHWSTNISVEIDDEFRDAVDAGDEHAEAVLAAVAVGMATNGEPGIVDTHAHSADEDTAIRSTNPCVAGDTWIQTTSGLRQVSDLAGSGEVELLVNDEVWNTASDGFFPTGTKRVLKVDVDGTPIRVTEDHLISTPDGWQTAGSLAVGDTVDLTDSLGNSWPGPGTEAEGYLLGHLIGDGYFDPPNKNGAPGSGCLCAWNSDEGSESVKQYILNLIDESRLSHRVDWSGWHQTHGGDKQALHSSPLRDLAQRFGITRHHKTVTEQVMGASSDFVTGLLRALFDTDGHIEGSSTSGGISVRLSQSDYDMLGNVRLLLLALGIKSSVRFGKGAGWKEMPGGTYWTKDCFRLIVSGRHVEQFSKLIGFANEAKAAKLDASMQEMSRGFYSKPMVGTIQSITQDGIEQVYDCQVPGLNAFVANGTIVHNCGEVSLNFDPTDAAGESCNLGSVDLAAFGTDHEGAIQAFRLMARFLYRATLNQHHEEAVRRIETINRRIGVGIMGLQGWVAAHDAKLTELTHRTDLLDQMVAFRSMARASADQLADELGLPRPVKVTAVAPTGTIAQMRGTTPGINAVMARYFIRRVRYADTDAAVAELEAAGHTVVDDIYAANTKVVEFVVRDGILDHYPVGLIEQSDEISAQQFFSVIAAIQEHFCGWGDGNAVSATAQIPAGMDPSELVSAIRPYLGRVKGLTVFPAISRDLSPYEAITEDQYNSLAAAGPVQSFGDSNSGECIGASCTIR